MKKNHLLSFVMLFFVLAVVVSGCGGSSAGNVNVPDTTPPTITSTSPAIDTMDAAVADSISFEFSEALDESTVTTATMTLSAGGSNVSGTVTYSGTTAIFTPLNNLDYVTTYTATITTGVTDLAGNALASDYILTFVTCHAPGSLDTTFDTDGMVTTVIGIDNEATAMVIQDDGKIVVAGFVDDGTGYYDFALARYNEDGSLDTDFGTGGKVTTDFNGGEDDYAYALAIQTDGKIVVVGTTNGVSYEDVSLARYESDGSLDTSFGIGGKVITGIGSDRDYGRAIAIQTDGKIVVAGSFAVVANYDFFVARYETDGSLDISFDDDGVVTTAIGSGSDGANAIGIQDDGKIVAAGYSHNGTDNDFALARYSADGSLDTEFDGDGIMTTSVGSGNDDVSALGVQNDGKIVVGGYSHNGTDNDFALARYNADGSLDTSFDDDGKVTTAIGTANDEAFVLGIQADEKIVMAGKTYNGTNYDFAMARYETDGLLDTSFGTVGIVATAIGSGDDYINALCIQTDGKIVAAGYSYGVSSGDFALARYWP